MSQIWSNWTQLKKKKDSMQLLSYYQRRRVIAPRWLAGYMQLVPAHSRTHARAHTHTRGQANTLLTEIVPTLLTRQAGQFASVRISWTRDWAFLFFFLQGRGRQIIWWGRNDCGCVDRRRGPRQRRKKLPGLIVLRRQGTEDDEEAFPWECCCVLLKTDTFPYLLPGEKQTLAAHMKGSFPGSVWAASRSNRALIEFEGERKRAREESAGLAAGPCGRCW